MTLLEPFPALVLLTELFKSPKLKSKPLKLKSKCRLDFQNQSQVLIKNKTKINGSKDAPTELDFENIDRFRIEKRDAHESFFDMLKLEKVSSFFSVSFSSVVPSFSTSLIILLIRSRD
ncbi:hypothetical protein BpHYR1_032373 [Brachionus plicatilis]|uniref:Uncharacterized protein n=1 Tax=Brachionus plicatilis TaxID=10195 RepID=A0A3M7SH49_BRAPC|nr:hypothetical protein BpHYR1_032373 [Brachionus plicatilis]